MRVYAFILPMQCVNGKINHMGFLVVILGELLIEMRFYLLCSANRRNLHNTIDTKRLRVSHVIKLN